MKILITGANGYIASEFMRANPQYEYIKITRENSDFASLLEIMQIQKPDIVLHLAGYYTKKHTAADVDKIIDSNISLGLHILQAMRETNIKRFIYISTIFQKFDTSLYTFSKKFIDDVLEHFSDIENTTLYIGDNFGENDTRPKLINLIKEAILSNTPFELNSSKLQEVNLLHISDVISGITYAIENNILGKYELINPKKILLKDIVYAMDKNNVITFGKDKIEIPSPQNLLPNWQPKIDVIQKLGEIL